MPIAVKIPSSWSSSSRRVFHSSSSLTIKVPARTPSFLRGTMAIVDVVMARRDGPAEAETIYECLFFENGAAMITYPWLLWQVLAACARSVDPSLRRLVDLASSHQRLKIAGAYVPDWPHYARQSLQTSLGGNDEMLRDDRILVQDKQVARIDSRNVRNEQVRGRIVEGAFLPVPDSNEVGTNMLIRTQRVSIIRTFPMIPTRKTQLHSKLDNLWCGVRIERTESSRGTKVPCRHTRASRSEAARCKTWHQRRDTMRRGRASTQRLSSMATWSRCSSDAHWSCETTTPAMIRRNGTDSNATTQSRLCFGEATTTFDLLVGQTTSASFLEIFIPIVASHLRNISDCLLNWLGRHFKLVGTGQGLECKTVFSHRLRGEEYRLCLHEGEFVQLGIEEVSRGNQSLCFEAYETGWHVLLQRWSKVRRTVLRLAGHGRDMASGIQKWLSWRDRNNGDRSEKVEYACIPFSPKVGSFASRHGDGGVKAPPLVKHESVGLCEDSLPVSSGHSMSKKYPFASCSKELDMLTEERRLSKLTFARGYTVRLGCICAYLFAPCSLPFLTAIIAIEATVLQPQMSSRIRAAYLQPCRSIASSD
ncbi:hypothetical protein KCU65_g193, partial [Aureobasidium melanogenum]